MPLDTTIIWRGASRRITVTVDTEEDVSLWTLVWRLGSEEGQAAELEVELDYQSGTTFVETLTAAEASALSLGSKVVFVIRTNAGLEDVLGREQYTVRDAVLEAE